MKRAISSSSLLIALAVCAGCGGAIADDVAEEVPEPFITETLRTMQQRDTQRLLTEVAEMPAVEEATEGFVARVTDGTLAALTEEERAARIAELTGSFVETVGGELARTVGAEVAPALGRAVAGGLERAIFRLTSEPGRARLAEAVRTVAQVGAQQLGYGIAEALQDPEVQLTLGVTARNVGRNVTLGAGDAIRELEERERERWRERGAAAAGSGGSGAAQGGDATDASVGGATEDGGTSWAAIAALVLAALLVAVIVTWRVQVRRRERALLALTDALKDAEGEPWEEDLRRTLRRRFRDDPDADYVREVLRDHPELRIGSDREPRRRFETAEAT